MRIREEIYHILLIGMLFCLYPSSGMGATYFVNKDGSGQAATIQAAVNMSKDGDTIIIEPGEYEENIVIKERRNISIKPLLDITPQSVVIHGVKGKKGVVLIFNSTAITIAGLRIIGGGNSPKNAVTVISSSALIQGCSIEKARSCGLYIIRNSDVEVIENQIFGNYTGLLYYDSRGTVRYSSIYSNKNNGLHITKKSRVSAFHNTFYQNQKNAILVEWAAHAEILNNIFSSNGTALRGASSHVSSDYNLYHDNRIDITGIKKGDHDLSGDPRFRNAAEFDFSLETDSPARNSDSDGLDRGGMPHK